MKKFKIIIIFLVIVVIIGLAAFLFINSKYNKAINDWDNKKYTEAADSFYFLKSYKDSEKYIYDFEKMLITSLIRTAWNSGDAWYTDGVYKATGYSEYTFSDDYSCVRTDFVKDNDGGDGSGNGTYNKYNFTYFFEIEGNSIHLRIGDSKKSDTYIIVLSKTDHMKIESLYGEFQFFEDYNRNYLPTNQ